MDRTADIAARRQLGPPFDPERTKLDIPLRGFAVLETVFSEWLWFRAN